MKNPSLKILLVTLGAVLFNIIFWQEKFALNSVLFDVFVLWSVFYLYPSSFKKATMKGLMVAHILTLIAVVMHNTFLSKLAFSATLLLIIAFTQYMHRSVIYAGGSILMNYILFIPSFNSNVKLIKPGSLHFTGLRKSIRFLVIPLLMLALFFILYNFANSIFKNMVNDALSSLQHFFLRFFDWFSWQRFWFFLLGLFIIGGLLLKSSIDYFSEKDKGKSDLLHRRKNDLKHWKKTAWYDLLSLIMGRFASGMLALRNENKTGIISLVLLNVLLLCINCVDIIYVWFGFTYSDDINLSQYVHDGTGLLIFSILIAMIVLLFFFRGNINFYKKNKWLRMAAYAWLFQNAILVVSVFFRDYYYIVHFGLAYKRIGVLVFLLMVVTGLVTVFIKIHQCKTAYFLLRINACTAIVLLVVASCIHWDETIAEYNLARKNTIPLDIKFLLSLSDKTFPVIEKNKDVLERASNVNLVGEGEYLYRSSLTPKQVFENRKQAFFTLQNEYTWLSWNMADDYVKKQLAHSPHITSTTTKN